MQVNKKHTVYLELKSVLKLAFKNSMPGTDKTIQAYRNQ